MFDKYLLIYYAIIVLTSIQVVSNSLPFSEQQLESDYDLDVSDFLVWSSIATSLAKWNDSKKARNRRKLEETAVKNNTHRRHRRRRDEEMVCYKNFGCFRDEGPFDYLDTLPASPETIATTFTLYTRKNSVEGEKMDYENITTVIKSNFNATNPIKIIIHGFGSSGRRPWVLQMTEAFLFMDDINVIVVDWENGATLPNYVQAAANTQLIGKQIALLIRMINFNRGAQPHDYHLIGFSLGAHVAGFTGMEVSNISRITGLDPAAPLFEGYPSRVRLDPSDAKFVDVIHSNGDSFIRGGLGSFAPLGHVDFYPNGGRVQVGCNSVFMGALSDIIYGKWNSLCNHRRAFRFFIDSVIRTCTFRAFACDAYENYLRGDCFDCGKDGTQCSNMGYFAHNSNGRGNMYLVTRESEPFCANQYKIRVISSAGQGSTWGKLEILFMARDGKNESFMLTNEADEIKDTGFIQGLVVAHPIIRNVTNIILTYTKYKGWIYSGKEHWSIDKIELINSDGEVHSFCGFATKLENSVSHQLSLTSGNCTNSVSTMTALASLQPHRIAKLFWQVVGAPVKGTTPKPPKLFWKILINEQSDAIDDPLDDDKYFWSPFV